jgi:hypothetical protein
MFVISHPPTYHGEDVLDEIRRLIGSGNWVVARRSVEITRRYGRDVVCLSPKRHAEIIGEAEQNLRMRDMLVGL